MREINPTKEELKDKTEALAKRRDELAKDDDVQAYVRTRRELRDAEADIEDGIADESLGRVLKQEIAALKQTPAVREYVNAVDKLRALSGVKPFEGDNTALSGMSNAESAKIISEAKKRGREKALERVSALVDGYHHQDKGNHHRGRSGDA